MAQRYSQRPSQIAKGSFFDFDFDAMIMQKAAAFEQSQRQPKSMPDTSLNSRVTNQEATRRYIESKTAEELQNEPPQKNWQSAIRSAVSS